MSCRVMLAWAGFASRAPCKRALLRASAGHSPPAAGWTFLLSLVPGGTRAARCKRVCAASAGTCWYLISREPVRARCRPGTCHLAGGLYRARWRRAIARRRRRGACHPAGWTCQHELVCDGVLSVAGSLGHGSPRLTCCLALPWLGTSHTATSPLKSKGPASPEVGSRFIFIMQSCLCFSKRKGVHRSTCGVRVR